VVGGLLGASGAKVGITSGASQVMTNLLGRLNPLHKVHSEESIKGYYTTQWSLIKLTVKDKHWVGFKFKIFLKRLPIL
jgi:hypothetical protein